MRNFAWQIFTARHFISKHNLLQGESKMTRIFYLPVLALALLFVCNPALADDSKELRKQRQDAQKERQIQKKERSDQIKESTRAFKDFTRQLTEEYQEQVKEFDLEFKLTEVDLKAEHDAKVAEAEAEYQKKLSGLFMKPGVTFDQETIDKLQSDGKAYADELFVLKKQSAEKLHQERIAHEERKNKLLNENDQKALDEAESLGLNKEYAPIEASAIGDGLTTQEERWNESEKKELDKIKEKNQQTLSPFRNGERLRKWEIQNLNEDFKLTWEEKAELHKLDAKQLFYNTMFMQAAVGEKIDQEAFMAELADINKEKKLINIEYKKIADQNMIKRRQEKKDILSQ
jgi:hypothetical protein